MGEEAGEERPSIGYRISTRTSGRACAASPQSCTPCTISLVSANARKSQEKRRSSAETFANGHESLAAVRVVQGAASQLTCC